jgi:hypothetical protein
MQVTSYYVIHHKPFLLTDTNDHIASLEAKTKLAEFVVFEELV